LSGCSLGSVLANIAAVVVCLLAVIGAVVVLFGHFTIRRCGDERFYRLITSEDVEPPAEEVLATVVSWACARQREGITVSGSEVLRVIERARQPKPAEGERGRT
jgi:hypothetical protein